MEESSSPGARQLSLLYVITSLDTGGAEVTLHKLLSTLRREVFRPRVVCLGCPGVIGAEINALGIPVDYLNLRWRGMKFGGIVELAIQIRKANADLVHTWMYHADLLGGVTSRLVTPRTPIVWGIRQGRLEPSTNKRSTILVAKASARISHQLPTKIVCCSEASRKSHELFGYSSRKMLVIPNGFDVDRFCPSAEAYQAIRRELEIPGSSLLVGMVGRFHPQKDHENFLRAAKIVGGEYPEAHFVLCGEGVSGSNDLLVQAARRLGILHRIHLLGRRSDIPTVIAAFDVAVSASSIEGFPNTVGEAMACGVPCVATDVGDAALILREGGIVVPPGDHQALAKAVMDLLRMDPAKRREVGGAGRARIASHYSLSGMTLRYEELYQSLVRK